MNKHNSYNEEDNDCFDNKYIVVKSNVEIIVKSNVEIVENGVYNRKMEYIYIYMMEMEMEMEYVIEKNGVYNRNENENENENENGVYNDCFDNRKMEYVIVGGNLCIQHPPLQITQVIPPPLFLNITNLLFLNKTNFAIIVIMVHREDLWSLFNFNLLQL